MKKYIIYLLMLLPLLVCGCNQEDDVFEIFSSGQTWHWSGCYSTTNWKYDNNFKLKTEFEDLYKINSSLEAFNINFEDDGKVSGNGENFTFTGQWEASGKDKSFHLNIQIKGSLSGLDKVFYDAIKSASYYRGNSQYIKLFNSNKSEYIQFYPLSSLKK